jgi:hypothetical protein
MGIGTPRSKSRIERIEAPYKNGLENAQAVTVTRKDLDRYHVVSLPAANGSGKAPAEGADQQGDKNPQ